MDLRLFRKIASVGLPLSFGFANFVAAKMQSPIGAAAYIPLQCPFKLLTGHPCPTCGLGRSVACTLTGNISLAWDYHPLGPIAVIGSVVLIGLMWIRPAFIERVFSKTNELIWAHPKRVWALITAYLTWGFLIRTPL